MFKKCLEKIIKGKILSEEEIFNLITDIMEGNTTDSRIGAFIGALAARGETFRELAGAARAMRRKAYRISANARTVVDTCGTGGDGLNTFNISTAAAFVVAGCGVTVAKHGNRSVSSRCGSADVLEALGVKIDVLPEVVEESVRQIGIGFLFAPIYHKAMAHAAKARKEVGVRSIFNMLGPLTNPAGANCQIIGVYAADLTEMFAKALQILGSKRALVVHGHDGMDEITISTSTRISELNDGIIKTYDVSPEVLLGRSSGLEEIKGGDPAENAEIIIGVFSGNKGAHRDIVVLNAAGALMAAGEASDFGRGIKKAESAIDNGLAMEKLQKLIKYNKVN